MAAAVESLQLVLLAIAVRWGDALHQGAPVQQQSYGYVMQIYGPKFLSAGSLFSARYVLTVAHCFRKNTKPEELSVRAGYEWIAWEYRDRPVAGLLRHPKFSPLTLRNDIAVLKVKAAILHSRKIKYIGLCSKPLSHKTSAQPQEVAGWSLMHINQPLKAIRVQVEPDKNCGHWFPQLPGGVTCVATTKGEGLCYGDSGDPLVSGGEVCGLAIAFRKCGDRRYPALFTDVHYHRGFIAQAVLTLDRELLKKPRGRVG
ncbi:trypsin alpha-3 [Drosophila santomea]|uniref:trypsin alpha-3 n=1 Tax=Drosophila santomea TaxID=129105 RepID=UPI001952CA63|nr:trypsin alpha-3 [Drosophila santomea]